MTASPTIRIVSSTDDIEAVRLLFSEYATSLGIDLCLQHFEEELAGLPGQYAPRPAVSSWRRWETNLPAAWR